MPKYAPRLPVAAPFPLRKPPRFAATPWRSSALSISSSLISAGFTGDCRYTSPATGEPSRNGLLVTETGVLTPNGGVRVVGVSAGESEVKKCGVSPDPAGVPNDAGAVSGGVSEKTPPPGVEGSWCVAVDAAVGYPLFSPPRVPTRVSPTLRPDPEAADSNEPALWNDPALSLSELVSTESSLWLLSARNKLVPAACVSLVDDVGWYPLVLGKPKPIRAERMASHSSTIAGNRAYAFFKLDTMIDSIRDPSPVMRTTHSPFTLITHPRPPKGALSITIVPVTCARSVMLFRVLNVC
mmetsp:Transcript_3255/g.11309  ORF Transcript_3255/g.11309 Transcript_3255/m.11309 type:complete len:296 (-) Transcript_3255:420-1307(-)